MSAAARINVVASGNMHSKRLRIAHEKVVKRLRGNPASAALVKIFDKHYSNEYATSFSPDAKDGKPFNPKRAWRRTTLVVLATVRFNKFAREAYKKKRGLALLGCRYQKFGQRAEALRDAESFGYFIITCIVIAGVLVGVQTYPVMADNPVLSYMDTAILYVFCLEILVKFVAESTRPSRYFTGPERAWNWFDFIIVVLCLPLPGDVLEGSLNPSFLRLLRLARITKIFNKVPQLQMIVSGLVHGLKSIVWILLLLLLIFYLFAVAGVLLFKQNDKFHFGNIPIAMVSLFRAATLENWSQLLYINYFGCRDYRANYEDATRDKLVGLEIVNKLRVEVFGGVFSNVFFDAKCTRSIRSPMLSTSFFLSFLVITSFVMLSLFIGAVTMGMAESMEAQEKASKEFEAERRRMKNSENESEIKALVDKAWDGLDENLFATVEKEGTRLRLQLAANRLTRGGANAEAEAKVALLESDDDEGDDNDNPTDTWSPGVGSDKTVSTSLVRSFSSSSSAKVAPIPDTFSQQQQQQQHHQQQPSSSTSTLRAISMPTLRSSDGSSTSRSSGGGSIDGSGKRRHRRHKQRRVRWCGGLFQFSRWYLVLARWCAVLEAQAWFSNFITVTILVASVMVGLGTEDKYADSPLMALLETVVLLIFIGECCVKIVARGFVPLDYFRDAWNVFDFAVVTASVAPLVLAQVLSSGSSGGGDGDDSEFDFGGIVAVFRLLRLLRIFKLAKQLKQLRVIVEALISGFSSITFISLILFIFFYVFAIIGMLLFASNDPHHFGSLHVAMITLFRSATMEDWTDLLYIEMFGCEHYGYPAIIEPDDDADSNSKSACVDSEGLGYIAVLYFVVFQILGGLILLSLFIGVVTTAMDNAERKAKQEEELEAQVEAMKAELGLSQRVMESAHLLFAKADLDEEQSISFNELESLFTVLAAMDTDFTLETILVFYEEVDEDRSGVLEFPEFLFLLLKIHRKILEYSDARGAHDRHTARRQARKRKVQQLCGQLEATNGGDPGEVPAASSTSSSSSSVSSTSSSTSSTSSLLKIPTTRSSKVAPMTPSSSQPQGVAGDEHDKADDDDESGQQEDSEFAAALVLKRAGKKDGEEGQKYGHNKNFPPKLTSSPSSKQYSGGGNGSSVDEGVKVGKDKIPRGCNNNEDGGGGGDVGSSLGPIREADSTQKQQTPPSSSSTPSSQQPSPASEASNTSNQTSNPSRPSSASSSSSGFSFSHFTEDGVFRPPPTAKTDDGGGDGGGGNGGDHGHGENQGHSGSHHPHDLLGLFNHPDFFHGTDLTELSAADVTEEEAELKGHILECEGRVARLRLEKERLLEETEASPVDEALGRSSTRSSMEEIVAKLGSIEADTKVEEIHSFISPGL